MSAKLLFFTLENKHVRFDFTNYGARWLNAYIPGIDDQKVDILQGFDTLESYEKFNNFYGTVCGRVGNRIAGAQFTLDGKTYHLTENVPGATLHGGPGGFHTKYWDVLDQSNIHLTLQYVSPDGEEGYPGTLTARVTYSIVNPQSLRVDLHASCKDKASPVNLAHHPFYNLAGHGAGHLRNHFFRINADYYYPIDERFTINEKKARVDNSLFDLRKSRKVFPYLQDDHPQVQLAGGYDHNFELTDYAQSHMREVAQVWEETSGRFLKIHTTLPGLQFYTCNSSGRRPGKDGQQYPKWGSFCLEPQYFPNSPNIPTFPNSIVRPGQPIVDAIIYEFGQQKSL
ncbi:MAG TPA: aldose epimerase family protein [Membranihabitans sp.]|nr:aldose epimerase family protein [Membranihabitans sp.]